MSNKNMAYRNNGPIYRGGNSSSIFYITVSGANVVTASGFPPFNIGSDKVKPLKDVEQF